VPVYFIKAAGFPVGAQSQGGAGARRHFSGMQGRLKLSPTGELNHPFKLKFYSVSPGQIDLREGLEK
jgi:hypothetical protein